MRDIYSETSVNIYQTTRRRNERLDTVISNAAFYSGSPGFKPRPRDRVYCLVLCVVLVSNTEQTPEIAIETGSGLFLPADFPAQHSLPFYLAAELLTAS
jgi:hypothetical protein